MEAFVNGATATAAYSPRRCHVRSRRFGRFEDACSLNFDRTLVHPHSDQEKWLLCAIQDYWTNVVLTNNVGTPSAVEVASCGSACWYAQYGSDESCLANQNKLRSSALRTSLQGTGHPRWHVAS